MSVCRKCQKREVCWLPCGILSREKGSPKRLRLPYRVELYEGDRMTFEDRFSDLGRAIECSQRLMLKKGSHRVKVVDVMNGKTCFLVR